MVGVLSILLNWNRAVDVFWKIVVSNSIWVEEWRSVMKDKTQKKGIHMNNAWWACSCLSSYQRLCQDEGFNSECQSYERNLLKAKHSSPQSCGNFWSKTIPCTYRQQAYLDSAHFNSHIRRHPLVDVAYPSRARSCVHTSRTSRVLDWPQWLLLKWRLKCAMNSWFATNYKLILIRMTTLRLFTSW